MAKPSLQNIVVSNTFQSWFDKTNELVDLFKSDAITASATGDSTTGDATLVGDFTADNLLATTQVRTNGLAAYSGGGSISSTSPINITTSSQEVVQTYTYSAAGPLVRWSDGTTSWDVGIDNTTDLNFVIDTGTGVTRFVLSPAGTLTVPNLITVEDVTVGQDLTVSGTMTVVDLVANNVFATGEVTTAYSGSDLKLKENLEVIPDAVEKVSQINGYTFNYKGKSELATGVVAQEIEKVLPGIVYDATNETGETYKAVRYGNIVGLLIEAIKELSQEVEKLKDGASD